MTSVAPPPPPPAAPSGGTSGAQLTVQLTSLPPQLAKLPLESLLSGLIRPANAQGQMQLQTNFGLLQFKPPFQLPANAQATFKLVQIQPVAQIQLTHINASPIAPNTPANRVMTLATQILQNAGTQQNTQGAQGQAAQVGTTPAATLNINSATGMKALVLSVIKPQVSMPQTAAPTPGAQAAPTPQSTLLNATSNGNTAPQGRSSVLQAGVQTAGTQTPGTAQAQGGTGPFQVGNQLSVRLLSVHPPGQAAQTTSTAAPSGASGNVVTTGTVQGQNAAGQPVVRLAQGTISLDTQAKFPEGTQVRLEVVSSAKPAAKAAAPSSALSNALPDAMGKSWPALEEALATLKAANPAVADQLSSQILPKPDSRLAANMLFFLKALGRGNLKNWADENALKILARVKPDLMSRLENDFSEIAAKAKQPNSTDWKIAFFPLQNGEQIDQIKIARRDHKKEELDGKDDPGVRFVIDVDLTKTGPMQLDGLAKEKAKKCDLIIRTHTALPGFMRKEIHDIYENGMMAAGFEGKLTFLVTPNFVDVDGVEMQANKVNLGMLV